MRRELLIVGEVELVDHVLEYRERLDEQHLAFDRGVVGCEIRRRLLTLVLIGDAASMRIDEHGGDAGIARRQDHDGEERERHQQHRCRDNRTPAPAQDAHHLAQIDAARRVQADRGSFGFERERELRIAP